MRVVQVYIKKPTGTQSVSTYGKRYKIEPTGTNPAHNNNFNIELKKNGVVYATIGKTFINPSFAMTDPTTQSFTDTNIALTVSFLLSALQTFNTTLDITYSSSTTNNTYGQKDIYINVYPTLTTDTWTLNILFNNTGSFNLSGPTSLTFSTVQTVYRSERLELFKDEKISVTSQVQNMNDISKVLTDYSQSFTVPASDHNNQIFSHWYENNVDNGFDHRIKYNAELMIDLISFKTGKITLEKANMKNNRVESYTVTFYGHLVNIKDRFKDDKLTSLSNEFSMTSLTHPWNTITDVKNRIITPYYSAVRYPLISPGNSKVNSVDIVRKYEYLTGSTNDITTTNGAIYWKELFPAIEVSRVLTAIQSKYGLTFTGSFLSSNSFLNKAWLYCRNSDKLTPYSDPKIIHWDSYAGDSQAPEAIQTNFYEWSSTNDTFTVDWTSWFNTTAYTNKHILFRISIKNVSTYTYPGILQVYKVVNGVETLFNTFNIPAVASNVVAGTFDVYSSYQAQDNNVSTFRYKILSIGDKLVFKATCYLEKFATVSGSISYYKTLGIPAITYSGIATSMYMRPATFFPDIAVSDFLIGIIKMFNLTINPIDENTFELLPLDDYYNAGKIYDVTEFISSKEINLTRPKLYSKINFQYDTSKSITNNYFSTNFGRQYGDLLYEDPNSVDTQTYEIKLPFENIMFEKTTGYNFITATTYDKDLKPYTPKCIILMENGLTGKEINGGVLSPMVDQIKLYPASSTPGSTLAIPYYFRFSNEVALAGTDLNYLYSLNFGNDISPWYLVNAPQSLYQTYYTNYIGNLYDLKTRVVSVKAIFPITFLNKLKINDRLIIRNKRYIINSMTTDLTTCDVSLELITDDRFTQLPSSPTRRIANFPIIKAGDGATPIENIIYLGSNVSLRQSSADSLDFQPSLYIRPVFTFVPSGFTEYNSTTNYITVNPSRWTGSTLKKLNVSIRIYMTSSGMPSDEAFYNVRLKRYNPITSITDTLETFDVPNAGLSGVYTLLDTLVDTQLSIDYVYKLEVSVSALANKNLNDNGSLSGGVSWYAQLRYEVVNDTYPTGNTFDLDNSSVGYNSLMCSKVENILDCLTPGFTEMQVIDGSTVIIPSATSFNGTTHGGTFDSCNIDVTLDVTAGITVKIIITENDSIYWVSDSDNSGSFDTGIIMINPGNTYKVYGMADTESDSYIVTVTYDYHYHIGTTLYTSTTGASVIPVTKYFIWPYSGGYLTQWFNKVKLPLLDTDYYEDTLSSGIIERNIQEQPRLSLQAIEYTDDLGNTNNQYIPVSQSGYVFNNTLSLPSYPNWLTNNISSIQFMNALSYDKNTSFTNTTSTFGSLGSTGTWAGGVLASNGKIYCAPFGSAVVLAIDTTTNTTSTFGSLGSSSGKWAGGVLAPNGNIYFVPYNSTTVLVVDPTTNTTSTFGSLGGGTSKWLGGVLAENGKIYCIPSSSTTNVVLVIDPTTNTTTYITGSGIGACSGGVLAPNGKIYCIPTSNTAILVIDTVTNTISSFGSLGVGSKWIGGVLAPNGKIYCAPSSATTVLVIDTTTNTTSTVGTFTGSNNWNGGALAPNGKIYFSPNTSTNVLVVDPVTNTTSTFSSTGSGGGDWYGAVLAPNGKLYFPPRSSTSVLVVGSTVIPQSTNKVLSRYLNKF